MSCGYRFAILSFSGDTFKGSSHDRSVESVVQSGRMMSEPIHSWDSIRHHDGSLEVELETELEFEYGAELVGAEVVFAKGAELLDTELLELMSDCKQAIPKPSKNLPAIVSAGTILPYAAISSPAHLVCTPDHHFAVDMMQAGVQRSVTFSVVQR